MSKLIVLMSDNPECIEGFSATCKRSVQGALHLRPRKSATVTDDEFDHIKKTRPDVAAKVRTLADKPDPKPVQKEDRTASKRAPSSSPEVKAAEKAEPAKSDKKEVKKFK